MEAVAIIPARFGAQRLPGKPLLDRTGKPLVCHVLDQAARARKVRSTVVATDDRRIAEAVVAHGARAILTSEDHPNGTSRIAEAAARIDEQAEAVVNVQGDEPEIDPEVIDRLVERLEAGTEPMATLASPFDTEEEPDDPNLVKVVVDQRERALYFSRAAIPFGRDAAPQRLKHPGLYAYRFTFLSEYVGLPATPAERAEHLEQLRALEHGHPIGIARTVVRHRGIDTEADYAAFVRRWHEGRRGESWEGE